jgi:uncharacterized protein YceH (UPF0502 family)
MDASPAIAVLNALERRVLGVMVEKAKTTPDAYPMSLNALTTGCNQKSNREPVMALTDEQVDATLAGLQQRGMVTRLTGSRVDRWRHNLYDLWSVDKVELAILTELMLRGPQTEGELRIHAGRMEPIDDLETLRQRLKPLAERKLVLFLGAEGRRGTQIADGLRPAEELEQLTKLAAVAAESPGVATAPSAPVASALQAEVAALKQQLQAVQQELQQVKSDVLQLKASLGG